MTAPHCIKPDSTTITVSIAACIGCWCVATGPTESCRSAGLRPPLISCGPRVPCALMIMSERDARGPEDHDAARGLQAFAYSRRKPSPQRLIWPTEGDGKCIVQHTVSVSQ